jgi:hypothetical protein
VILTETQAKTKRCPLPYAAQPGFSNEVTWNCRASACMAWRWEHQPKRADAGVRDGQDVGYCGIGGQP